MFALGNQGGNSYFAESAGGGGSASQPLILLRGNKGERLPIVLSDQLIQLVD